MSTARKETYTCEHCGAEADLIIEGFEGVKDVVRKNTKRKTTCQSCGRETEIEIDDRQPFACEQCGAEADMTLEGIEKVEDVVRRSKKLSCKSCGQEISWTGREDLKAIEIAMEAEKEAAQFYSKASKKTKDPKGRAMFQQLSEFEGNHYQKLKELMKTLRDTKEWIIYSGTPLRQKTISRREASPKGQELVTDMDALKLAIREEKKAQSYYRSMAELTTDPRGKGMYKRLAEEESLHEKVLNDQFYSIHNTGLWSWGD